MAAWANENTRVLLEVCFWVERLRAVEKIGKGEEEV